MQNKKSNKYFEEQNTKPSRVSGNVRKRSSLKKGDYATGLFNDGNGSEVDSRKQDYPFKSPQRPSGYGIQPYGKPQYRSKSGPENAVRGGIPNERDTKWYNENLQEQEYAAAEAAKRIDTDVLNDYSNYYEKPSPYIPNSPSPFDAYNVVKEFRRKNPTGDTIENWGKNPLITQNLPFYHPEDYNPNIDYRRDRKLIEIFLNKLFPPKFKEYSD